ncbi:hypothetical protein [Paenisporosarcina sp.]|uniref:hypothetical protein n=1 Tax=Paenisporosarcina sp. TaxID=1932001 RepID=UPI003C71918E
MVNTASTFLLSLFMAKMNRMINEHLSGSDIYHVPSFGPFQNKGFWTFALAACFTSANTLKQFSHFWSNFSKIGATFNGFGATFQIWEQLSRFGSN